MQLPGEDQLLLSRSQLFDQIKGLLGGRASEELVFDDVTTGAENDLDRATQLARHMVCIYGMSNELGLVHWGHRQNPFLALQPDGTMQRDFSEKTGEHIDNEVRKLLDEAYGEAKSILVEHREQLDTVARELLERESLDGAEFHKLIGRNARGDSRSLGEAASS
jgi:cell division protease FtsH